MIDGSHIQKLRRCETALNLGNRIFLLKRVILFQGPAMPKMPQMDLIAELKKRQVKPQVREGKDGALEDIITGNAAHHFTRDACLLGC